MRGNRVHNNCSVSVYYKGLIFPPFLYVHIHSYYFNFKLPHTEDIVSSTLE